MKTITAVLCGLCMALAASAQSSVWPPFNGGGGSGSGGGGGQYSTASLSYAVGTWYVPPGGGLAASTTEAAVQGVVTVAGTVANFSASLSAPPGLGNSVTYTWRLNGAGQTLTCAISGAVDTSCRDTTHTFTVAVGDLIDIEMVIAGDTVVAAQVLLWGLPGERGPAGAAGSNGSAASTSYTYATRPAGTTGMFATITDCSDLSCSSGGGSIVLMEWFDGTDWQPFVSVSSCAGCAGSITLGSGTGDAAVKNAAVANCASTGTTVNKLAKIVGGCAVIATTSDTAIPLYCVVGGAGTTGYPDLVIAGQGTCKVEAAGGVTADHFLVASATTAATLHDAGATAPTSGWVIGQAVASASANANVQFSILPGYNAASGGGGSATPHAYVLSSTCTVSGSAASGNLANPIGGGNYCGAYATGTGTWQLNQSTAAGDVYEAIMRIPGTASSPITLTQVDLHLNGFTYATGNMTWTASVGCIKNGDAKGGLSLGSTVAATQAGVVDTMVYFDMEGLQFGTCASGDSLHVYAVRSGANSGAYGLETMSVELWY